VGICKAAGFNCYSECTDLLTGIEDKVTKVTYWRRALAGQSSSSCSHLHLKCEGSDDWELLKIPADGI